MKRSPSIRKRTFLFNILFLFRSWRLENTASKIQLESNIRETYAKKLTRIHFCGNKRWVKGGGIKKSKLCNRMRPFRQAAIDNTSNTCWRLFGQNQIVDAINSSTSAETEVTCTLKFFFRRGILEWWKKSTRWLALVFAGWRWNSIQTHVSLFTSRNYATHTTDSLGLKKRKIIK